MGKKNVISATICLVAALTIAAVTGKNFMDIKAPDTLHPSANVTETKMLSDYFGDLKGTNSDTPIYVFKGSKPGGSMLILGGTHPNEPAGYLAAVAFLENAKVDQGTVYVIPRACNSGFTNNDAQEASPQYLHFINKNGQERQFRYGSRAANPVDQWPDPDVYIHAGSGQQLSGSETRNLNRCYPGRPDGNLMEKTAYAIVQLIKKEGVNLTFDLHESSPEYPVNDATVTHEKCMDFAAEGMLNLQMEGINMSLEPSPTNLHGLTHRELGDYTDTYPVLMEAPNASQGRLRGATNEEMALTGKDKFYVSAEKLGFVYVPYDENGHPIEERVGRHLQGIIEYTKAFSSAHSDKPVSFENVPGYEEMFTDADPSQLGGARFGSFLN